MKRFQTALKNQLTKQDEKVTLELRELVSQLSLYIAVNVQKFGTPVTCQRAQINSQIM